VDFDFYVISENFSSVCDVISLVLSAKTRGMVINHAPVPFSSAEITPWLTKKVIVGFVD
jgi:hypothetical protein